MKEKFNKIQELAIELSKSKASGGGCIILAIKDNEEEKFNAVISSTNGPHVDLITAIVAAMKRNKEFKGLILEAVMLSAIDPYTK